jgi:hypothetical protein
MWRTGESATGRKATREPMAATQMVLWRPMIPPRKMNGRDSIVASRPNSNGVTLRIVAATIGRARSVIWVPKTLTVSAVQSFRKSGWRSRLRDG